MPIKFSTIFALCAFAGVVGSTGFMGGCVYQKIQQSEERHDKQKAQRESLNADGTNITLIDVNVEHKPGRLVGKIYHSSYYAHTLRYRAKTPPKPLEYEVFFTSHKPSEIAKVGTHTKVSEVAKKYYWVREAPTK